MQLASIHLALIGRMSVSVGWLVGRPVGSVQFNLKAIIDGRNPFQYKTMASNTHKYTNGLNNMVGNDEYDSIDNIRMVRQCGGNDGNDGNGGSNLRGERNRASKLLNCHCAISFVMATLS